MDKEQLSRQVAILRELNIRRARESLWSYCCLLSPDFYKPERWHLWLLCECLQALYERRLTKKLFYDLCHAKCVPAWYGDTIDWDRLLEDLTYVNLMINMPPRHGKSRTLVNFCDWILGRSLNNKIISVSYNTDLASDMSRYVRDGIMMKRNLATDIVYSDIFPNTRIARGNSGFMKWALDGCYFNYLGAGLEGTITGKGASISIIDDPVKNAEESYNDRVLEGIFNWYTGTFMSRSEKEGEGSIGIINHTRWNTKDLCGRILESRMGRKWMVLSLPVEHEGDMLCKTILPYEDFCDLRDNMDPNIFRANYYQEPVDIKGRLFTSIKTYEALPEHMEKFVAYVDTADTGEDYLICICGGQKEGEGFITDVYYTQAAMEVTEPETARRLVKNKVNHCKIESNNGGRGFARNVEQHIWNDFHSRDVHVDWFHQSENKMARILTGATFVMQHIYFPENWARLWPDFYLAIMSFQKAGGNKHDDAAEGLVEFGKMIRGDGSFQAYMDYMKKLKESRDKKQKGLA